MNEGSSNIYHTYYCSNSQQSQLLSGIVNYVTYFDDTKQLIVTLIIGDCTVSHSLSVQSQSIIYEKCVISYCLVATQYNITTMTVATTTVLFWYPNRKEGFCYRRVKNTPTCVQPAKENATIDTASKQYWENFKHPIFKVVIEFGAIDGYLEAIHYK